MKIKVAHDVIYFLDVNGLNFALPIEVDTSSIENTIIRMAREITAANLQYVIDKYGLKE